MNKKRKLKDAPEVHNDAYSRRICHLKREEISSPAGKSERECPECLGTGQDDPPRGKYHGLCLS